MARQPENMHLRRQMMRGVSGGHQNGGRLLREPAAEHPPAAAGGTASLTLSGCWISRRRSCCDRCWSRYWRSFTSASAGGIPAQQLAETLGAGRDQVLERLVLDIHGKIQSHAYPMRWLERLREQWQQVPESVGPYREVLTDSILRRTRFWAKADGDGSVDGAVSDLYRGYGDRFLEMGAAAGYETAAQEGWDAMARLKPAFRRMGVVKRAATGAKEQAQAVRKRCRTSWMRSVRCWRSARASSCWRILEAMAPAMLALVQLTEDFTAAYQAEKVRRNCMDFSDQEHYAIRLFAG